MKTIKQPIDFNHIKQCTACVQGVLSLITLSIIMLGLLMPKAHAEEPYRFDRLWPNLAQPWYFVFPEAIAIDSRGLVYVANSGFDSIQVFSLDGELIRSWGSEGSGREQFNSPNGIAISATSGNVYVADTDNHRIQIFSADGVYIDEWGKEGSGDGEFVGPSAIAVNATSDEVYVVDRDNHRIQVFSAKGDYIDQWGSQGSGVSEFSDPQRIAVSATSGEVYVADTKNNRIQIFSAKGDYIDQWGSQGSGNGEFSVPEGIAISASGDVYVADSENNRVQVFSAKGVYIDQWGSKGSKSGEFNSPQGIAISANGELYVVEMSNQRVQIFDVNGVFKHQWGSTGSGKGEFSIPNEIAVSVKDEVYVADRDNHRIQVFDVNGVFQREWGSQGSGNGEFSFPVGIAVSDSSDKVYVVDRSNHRIQIFSAEGDYIDQWGSRGSGIGEFNFPKAIAVSAKNEVYVVDRSNHRIQIFSAEGDYIDQWGSRGSGIGEINFPKAIAVSAKNEVYVADTFNDRIQVFDARGRYQDEWGGTGLENDEFIFPGGIAVSASGEVYVTEFMDNPRIKIFDDRQMFVESIGSQGSSPGQVIFPSGMAFDSKGALYVVDTGNNRIQKFVRGQPSMNEKLRKAIILAGGGRSKGSYTNLIWNETEKLSKNARYALINHGFQKEDIKFLTAGDIKSDLDQNGKPDDFEYASLDNLEQAITQWAVDADNVVIYLIDHGGPGIFAINDKETLKEVQLTAWVNILNEKIPGKVTLIIEACKSASFLQPLANKIKRINLISSTNADQPNTVSNGGLNSFSFFFWSAINYGNDLQKAYRAGKQGIQPQRRKGDQEIPQDPHLDSDGDQQFNTVDDFTTLADFCLGICTDSSPSLPKIVNPTAPTTLNDATEAILSMQVESKKPILRAWVVIKRPDFKHTNSNEPISDLPEIKLECDDNKLCAVAVNHKKFDVNGKYVITYYVLDTKLQLAPPKVKILTQKQGIPICTLDADGNGSFDALTDGLLSIRYLFGLRGDSLMTGAVASNCANCSAAEVEPILEQCGTAGTSDIDGNGQVDALTDGLLTIRYLFGLRDESLINGSVANDCSRCTALEIEAYMQGLMS